MVLPDSHRISRAPWYLGSASRESRAFRLQGFHPLRLAVPGAFDYCAGFFHSPAGPPPRPTRPRNPAAITPVGYPHDRGLGFSPFARRYWGSRACFPLLGVLRCFSSPAYPPGLMDWARDSRPFVGRVAPFGCLRITACLRLPGAFRSLPRPSSAASA